jgi:Ca2+-transporting ATPase
MPRPPDQPWAEEALTVAGALTTDPAAGLTEGEAARRLLLHGPNELAEARRRPAWRVLASQFADTMIAVLIVAGIITAFLGDLKDTLVIAAIVVLNGIVGFAQEWRAEEAMAALRALTSPMARVVRDGVERPVRAATLVPGDLVRLEAGDVVAADLRLVHSIALRVNEAALTGESEPAAKTAAALPDIDGTTLADQRNIAFKGTAVTYGRGAGIVVTSGMDTALGRIAGLLGSHDADQTPLQRRLSSLGRVLAAVAIGVGVVIFTVGIARGEDASLMFLTAVSLAVAAIPEALPAVVTVALALGAARMARRHALVRRLPAVETLGSVTVVCTDKTGTLTQNRMVVERAWTPAGTWRVEGSGYAPTGTVLPDGPASSADPWLPRLAAVARRCNDARLHPPTEAGGAWTLTGDPTEGALLAFAGRLEAALGTAAEPGPRPTRAADTEPGPDGLVSPSVHRGDVEQAPDRVAELAFDSDRRRMTTVHRMPDGLAVAVKGALDALVPYARADEAPLWAAAAEADIALAAQGYRVLALADRIIPIIPDDLAHLERDLSLTGLVAMADPPRPEATDAVATARAAGITPVMITGDHARTAEAIATRMGILGDGRGVMTGAELAELDDAALDARVADVAVYARTNPEQKLRIVDAWKTRGAVVAMTGDGVNDAPALRRSDIGVAMGITGTEVSREAADMVLADDDFATIVVAVEEGRRIYDNIRRFVRYMLTTNSAEVWVMALAPFLGLPIPLLPVQILWINLVTDGLPGLALSVEPAEPDTMTRRPRPARESIIAGGLWQQAVWLGLTMAVVTLGVMALAIDQGWHWQTMVFTTLALLQLGHALAIRSERWSLFQLGWRSNRALSLVIVGSVLVQLAVVYLPLFQGLFQTQALGLEELVVVGLASTVAFMAVEAEKWLRRRRHATEMRPNRNLPVR